MDILNASRFGNAQLTIFKSRIVRAKSKHHERRTTAQEARLHFLLPAFSDIGAGFSTDAKIVVGEIIAISLCSNRDSPCPAEIVWIACPIDIGITNKTNAQIVGFHGF